MLHVYSAAKLVATINRQHPGSDGYQPQLPWLLLNVSGSVRRHPTLTAARDDALKQWAPCRFRKT